MMSCDENESTSIEKLRQINCKVGSMTPEDGLKKQDSILSRTDSNASGAKPKRKTRSTRRRLNAMMSNVSLHFSDTDSEGELSMITPKMRTLSPAHKTGEPQQPPLISVTLENTDGEPADSHWDGMDGGTPTADRSFAENLTDVDEIYFGSDQENQKTDTKGLNLPDQGYQGETDVEDMSNDEGDVDDETPFYEAPVIDILREFGGGTITTKEGNGPFSVEVRNQMSFDDGGEPPVHMNFEAIPQGPGTDSEDVDVSDEEEELEGACGQRVLMEDFELLAASQIIMKNVNKMENSLHIPDATDEGISDSHTDIEDLE